MVHSADSKQLLAELSNIRQQLLTLQVNDSNQLAALISRMLDIIDLVFELNDLNIEQAKAEVVREISDRLPEIISENIKLDLDRRFDEAVRKTRRENPPSQ